jgi:hypothetical protein
MRRRRMNDPLGHIRQHYVDDLQRRFGWTGDTVHGNTAEEIYSNYLIIYQTLLAAGVPELPPKPAPGKSMFGNVGLLVGALVLGLVLFGKRLKL